MHRAQLAQYTPFEQHSEQASRTLNESIPALRRHGSTSSSFSTKALAVFRVDGVAIMLLPQVHCQVRPPVTKPCAVRRWENNVVTHIKMSFSVKLAHRETCCNDHTLLGDSNRRRGSLALANAECYCRRGGLSCLQFFGCSLWNRLLATCRSASLFARELKTHSIVSSTLDSKWILYTITIIK